jgi:transposase InsO family protein
MPWKVEPPVSELRLALVHSVRTLGRPVAATAREFGVSRKTAYKWLAAHDADPVAPALADRSRRPARSPGRTADAVEAQVLAVRDRRNWGPRKIHAYLRASGLVPPDDLPTARTVARVLRRHGRVGTPAPTPELQRFERTAPNDLWQLDHQGRVEVERRKLHPLTVIDDHSRYLLAYEPLPDKTMARVWDVLWGVFERAGMPRQVLCDNAFGTMGPERPVGLSWFDARLVRCGVAPAHGRPYHPQTQGKVERLHGTAARELLFFDARRDRAEHFAADCARWRADYNALRPHEALGDAVPLSRWRPATAERPRPPRLPEPESYYPPGAELRRACAEGLVRVDGARVLVGRGVAGQTLRLERREQDDEVAVYYCWKRVRCLSREQLTKDNVL